MIDKKPRSSPSPCTFSPHRLAVARAAVGLNRRPTNAPSPFLCSQFNATGVAVPGAADPDGPLPGPSAGSDGQAAGGPAYRPEVLRRWPAGLSPLHFAVADTGADTPPSPLAPLLSASLAPANCGLALARLPPPARCSGPHIRGGADGPPPGLRRGQRVAPAGGGARPGRRRRAQVVPLRRRRRCAAAAAAAALRGVHSSPFPVDLRLLTPTVPWVPGCAQTGPTRSTWTSPSPASSISQARHPPPLAPVLPPALLPAHARLLLSFHPPPRPPPLSPPPPPPPAAQRASGRAPGTTPSPRGSSLCPWGRGTPSG